MSAKLPLSYMVHMKKNQRVKDVIIPAGRGLTGSHSFAVIHYTVDNESVCRTACCLLSGLEESLIIRERGFHFDAIRG